MFASPIRKTSFPHTALLAMTAALAIGCVGETDLGPCTDCQVLDPLESYELSVASCSRADMQIVCQWTDEESLARAPIAQLQAGMSFWTATDERVTPSLNEGGQVIYNLEGTAWMPGRDVEFRIEIAADTSGELLVFTEDSQIVGMDLLEAGYVVDTPFELWDLGLIANDPMSASIGFAGAVDVPGADMLIDFPAEVSRVIVDPSAGVDILVDGEVVGHASKPGYYRFTDRSTVVYDDTPTSYEKL